MPHSCLRSRRRSWPSSRGMACAVVAACVWSLIPATWAANEEGRATSDDSVVVAGRVRDLVRGGAVAGAVIRIRPVGKARTSARGRYRIRIAKDDADPGLHSVSIRRRGYWRRDTWLSIDSKRARYRRKWTLLPRDGGFSMEFFDRVVRGSNGMTARWLRAPRFRVVEQRLTCVNGLGVPVCEEWEVTASPITATLRALFVETVEDFAGPLTGGLVSEPVVESLQLPSGTMLAASELMADGVFSLAEYTAVGPRAVLPRPEGGDVIDTQVWLVSAPVGASKQNAIAFVARGLGFIGTMSDEFCARLSEEGVVTALCESHGVEDPTEFDAVHGTVLYSRPPGNRHPDEDSPSSAEY